MFCSSNISHQKLQYKPNYLGKVAIYRHCILSPQEEVFLFSFIARPYN